MSCFLRSLHSSCISAVPLFRDMLVAATSASANAPSAAAVSSSIPASWSNSAVPCRCQPGTSGPAHWCGAPAAALPDSITLSAVVGPSSTPPLQSSSAVSCRCRPSNSDSACCCGAFAAAVSGVSVTMSHSIETSAVSSSHSIEPRAVISPHSNKLPSVTLPHSITPRAVSSSPSIEPPSVTLPHSIERRAVSSSHSIQPRADSSSHAVEWRSVTSSHSIEPRAGTSSQAIEPPSVALSPSIELRSSTLALAGPSAMPFSRPSSAGVATVCPFFVGASEVSTLPARFWPCPPRAVHIWVHWQHLHSNQRSSFSVYVQASHSPFSIGRVASTHSTSLVRSSSAASSWFQRRLTSQFAC